jgi:hypothetical protein
VIEYQSKSDNTVTILMLPLMLLGHFHYRRSRISFTTYHYLAPSEARNLRLILGLKKFFLPMTVLALLTSGIALVIALIMIAVVVFNPPPPTGKAHPEYIAVAMLIIVSIFVAALKAQRWFWKRGIPPGTSEFSDQSIRLESVKLRN